MKKRLALFILFVLLKSTFPQTYKILESTTEQIKIEVNFENAYQFYERNVEGKKFSFVEGNEFNLRNPGEPYLPNYILQIGIPFNSDIHTEIISINSEKKNNIFILPTPDSLEQSLKDLNFNQDIYSNDSFFPKNAFEVSGDFIFRFARIATLSFSPFQFNPITREVIQNKHLVVVVKFVNRKNSNPTFQISQDQPTLDILSTTVINYETAKNFVGEIKSSNDSPAQTNSYWYDPHKDYLKIYLNTKGVYRITYEMLINAGLPDNGISQMNFALYNEGNSMPIDVVDKDSNGVFNAGDYFQFVGSPPKPADAYANLNIYNLQNVYWFSYQADSLNLYKHRDGYPTSGYNLIFNTIETLKWGKDEYFSHLGQAPDDKRDYWYWDFIEWRSGYSKYFTQIIPDSAFLDIYIQKPKMKLKIGLHGLTSKNCGTGFGHSAQFLLNSYPVGALKWNGQNSATFEKEFFISFSSAGQDTMYLNWANTQELIIRSTGEVCDTSLGDSFLLNFIEIEFWKQLKTFQNYFIFTSPPGDFGENIYWMSNWHRDNMKIYLPDRGELISNPWITNDASNSVRFVDTLFQQTEYYCVADDYFLTPDSLVHKNTNSDLRNVDNAADYIIITHPLFIEAANRLATFRSQHLKRFNEPRIKIVNIFDIYDEFSNGLMSPFAVKSFVKYTYENWQRPAPYYVTLMGDLSTDYRKILPTSRENFIPSIPYHVIIYGQASSDNQFVAVAGNDFIPDLAIGRISCETSEEANLLVDKIINYPADGSKEWKQNVALFSSGLTAADEESMKFNDRNIELHNSYLAPNGITSTKVFRYPNKPEYLQYQGAGPEMRKGIDDGAVIVNYYGHGGGFQWDLVFTNDDILALQNGFKLPFVSSVTCYTAHYDNQEIFGEIFNSLPDRGSIAFWGSTGVTLWPTGHSINRDFFREVFANKRHIIGDAILKAKTNLGYGTMVDLLTLLGDPALELAIPYYPDFAIKSSDISITPRNPIKDDTVVVKVAIKNFGRSFISDTVSVQLFENLISDTTLIGLNRLSSFGENDTTYFTWLATSDGLKTLIVVINEVDTLMEIDHSDNIASASFSVYSFESPKIVKPVNNYYTNQNKVNFIIVDIGLNIQKEFKYWIEIDSSRDLNSNVKIQSPLLTAVKGIVSWKSPQLSSGEYFWRAYIIADSDTNKSDIQTFSINSDTNSGYIAKGKQLLDFNTVNVNYSDSTSSLTLNILPLPPRPTEEKLIDSILIPLPSDSTEITSFTTDGSYLYFGHVSYYRNGRPSKIYKIGTGLNGTIKGFNYGTIGNIEVEIKNQLFYHSDGFLYVATGDDSTLLRVNLESADTSRIDIPAKMLPSEDGLLKNGGFYLVSDGNYVYNLTPGYGDFRNKYTLRIFNPSQNWQQVGEDKILFGSSAYGFNSFFVADDYLIAYESYLNGYQRRYRISTNSYEEEYITFVWRKTIYGMAYDWENNFVYGGLFTPNNFRYDFGFFKFVGTYLEAQGTITTNEVGPARKWKKINYNLETVNSTGHFDAKLFGKNSITQNWDTLLTTLQPVSDISFINPLTYPYIEAKFTLTDSSFGLSEPMKLKSVKVEYDCFPEINLGPSDVVFDVDSMLQGFPVNMSLKVDNVGYTTADSLRLDFYNNIQDSAFFTTYANVPPDSFSVINKVIPTDNLLYTAPVSPVDVRVIATPTIKEYYDFNNSSEGHFDVIRDSLKPAFNITFDGKEILNGDVISSQPHVLITLEDNSPLPLDTSYFTIVHTENNKTSVVRFNDPDLTYNYSPYPNSKMEINWLPKLKDGKHILEVLAKDGSGNFFDSTSSKSVFYVYNNPDILQVYNYPNPFTDNTYFTFELRGVVAPDEIRIKIFTIAGRLIKEIQLKQSDLQIGFNKITWDGRDEDGDVIANGLYFYKVLTKTGDEVKVITQKLAKLR